MSQKFAYQFILTIISKYVAAKHVKDDLFEAVLLSGWVTEINYLKQMSRWIRVHFRQS